MTTRKWTPGYVQQRFPAEVRELLLAEGEDPDIKPTHKWLRENGYSGIQGYAERHDKTVDDVLLGECDFDQREENRYLEHMRKQRDSFTSGSKTRRKNSTG